MAEKSAADRRKNRRELSQGDQEFLNFIRATFGRHSKGERENRYLDRSRLMKALRIRDAYLGSNLFRILDADGDGRVSEADFVDSASGVILGSDQRKIRFIFDLHDADGDGRISGEELDDMFRAALRRSRLRVSPKTRKELAAAMVTRGGKRKYIDLSDFREILNSDSRIRATMLASISSWFGVETGNEYLGTRPGIGEILRYIFVVLPHQAWRYLLVIAYVGANVWFFADAFLTYREAGANIFIQIARGGGACLNFNGMLILIPMMRTFLTWIRKSFLFHFVPVDENIEIHKVVGRVLFLFALVHTGAHIGNYIVSGLDVGQQLLYTRVGLTGTIAMGSFLFIWFFSLKFIRRSRFFEWFSATHLLYLVWFPAALIHVRSFFQWTIIPVAGFVLELLIRRLAKHHHSFIEECDTHDSGVTHLKIRRPETFRYNAGEYLFIRIPKIGHFGWHPFTISSAPEQKRTVDIHVRALGNWTRRLHTYMSGLKKQDRRLPVVIHGPYGTPAARIFRSRVAVLVGAGIGVTPFASILESILLRKEQGLEMNIEKVYFYWVYRGQDSYRWFASLLERLEERNLRLLDINIYLTDARIDPVTGLINIAMELRRKSKKEDALTGLKSRTNFGRPDWNQIFDGIAAKHQFKRVDVFFCGPYPLGKLIQRSAGRRGFHFRMENF
jgi:predicted ferric reductase